MSSIWPGERLRKKEWICLSRPGDGGVGYVVLQPGPDAFDRVVVRAVAGTVQQFQPKLPLSPGWARSCCQVIVPSPGAGWLIVTRRRR
jgi:hypothetical protein